MIEILLYTHPCYPIDASVSRGYAGIFFAHTCSVLSAPGAGTSQPLLGKEEFPATQLHSQSCAVERLAGPFYQPEHRILQFKILELW